MCKCSTEPNTPILANTNKMAEIKCSHDDSSKPYMQMVSAEDTAMALIVLSYGATADPNYEDGFKDRLNWKEKIH